MAALSLSKLFFLFWKHWQNSRKPFPGIAAETTAKLYQYLLNKNGFEQNEVAYFSTVSLGKK